MDFNTVCGKFICSGNRQIILEHVAIFTAGYGMFDYDKCQKDFQA